MGADGFAGFGGVGVGVGVKVGVIVGVAEGVIVGEGVRVLVGVGVSVEMGVAVGPTGVAVGVIVGVDVGSTMIPPLFPRVGRFVGVTTGADRVGEVVFSAIATTSIFLLSPWSFHEVNGCMLLVQRYANAAISTTARAKKVKAARFQGVCLGGKGSKL